MIMNLFKRKKKIITEVYIPGVLNVKIIKPKDYTGTIKITRGNERII